MIKLETERLILRNYRDEDIHDLYEFLSHEEVARYEVFHPMSIVDVKDMLDDWKTMDNRLVVELKAERKTIGCIGYFSDEDYDYSMDFDFNPAYGKRGYATEAGEKLLNHIFTSTGVTKIYGDCDIRNEDSWRLLERLGFMRIRIVEDVSYKNDFDGQPIKIDVYLYVKYPQLSNK